MRLTDRTIDHVLRFLDENFYKLEKTRGKIIFCKEDPTFFI